MAYSLEMRDRRGRRRRFLIPQFPCTIGSDDDNDLTLRHRSMSRRHATIHRVGGHLVVVDESGSGTVFVKGEAVQQKVIRPNDELRIGSIDLVLRDHPLQTARDVPDSSVRFLSDLESWDPLESQSAPTISGALPGDRSEAAGPDWGNLLRFALESPPDHVYDGMLDIIAETISFDRCHVILSENRSADSIRIVASRKGRSSKSRRHALSDVLVSHQILERVMKTGQAVLVSSRSDDSINLRQSFITSGAKTAICLPLSVRSQVHGVLYMDVESDENALTESDLDTLGPIAGLFALKLENALLEKSRLATRLAHRELQIAETVQRSMYPKTLPESPGFSLDGHTHLSSQVGGDFFDVVKTGDSEITWFLGGVSGRGLPSALYMVSVLSTIRAHLRDELCLEAIVRRLEIHVRDTFRPEYFMTFCIGTLNTASGLLTYCDAGSLPPFVVRHDGGVVELASANPALNLFPVESFQSHEYRMEPGDLFVAYTDGAVRGGSEDDLDGEDGHERLIRSVREGRNEALPALRASILADIDDSPGGEGVRDDVTIVLVRREAIPE